MEEKLETTQNENLKEMLEAGVVYGHRKSKTHPKMKPHIFSTRNGIELIDLPGALAALDRTKSFLKEKIAGGANVLMVATQPAAQRIIEDFAKNHGFPYMTERWLGGILTNFKVINTRINYYLDLKAKKDKGELDKYTKKERAKIDKELGKMGKSFSGLTTLTKLPEILFVVDSGEHMTAINEARLLKIPVIAIASTDCDPAKADYLIPSNDHSKTSIEWILKYLEPALIKPSDKIQ